MPLLDPVGGATETRARGSHTLAVTADARLAFTANQAEGSLEVLRPGRRILAEYRLGTERLSSGSLHRGCGVGFDLLDQSRDSGSVLLGREMLPAREGLEGQGLGLDEVVGVDLLLRVSPNVELVKYGHGPDPVNFPGQDETRLDRLTFFWTF